MLFNHILAKLRALLAVLLVAATLPLATVYSAASSSSGFSCHNLINEMTQLTFVQDWDIKAFCKAHGLDLEEMWDQVDKGHDDDFEVLLKAMPTIQAAIKKLFTDYSTSEMVQATTEISRIRTFLQTMLLLSPETKIYNEDGTELEKHVCSLQSSHLDQEFIQRAMVVSIQKTEVANVVKKIGLMLATYFEQDCLKQRNQDEDKYIFSAPRLPLVLGMYQGDVVIASFPVVKQSAYAPFIDDYYFEHELLKDTTSTFVQVMSFLFAVCSVFMPTVATKFPSLVDEFCAQQWEQFLADEPFVVIGLDSTATEKEVKSQCRKLAKTMHPDKGGDAEQWRHIKDACEKIQSNFEVNKKVNEVKEPADTALL